MKVYWAVLNRRKLAFGFTRPLNANKADDINSFEKESVIVVTGNCHCDDKKSDEK